MTATVARNTAGILIVGAGMSYGSNCQLLITSEREAASYAESYTVYLCIGLCIYIGYMFSCGYNWLLAVETGFNLICIICVVHQYVIILYYLVIGSIAVITINLGSAHIHMCSIYTKSCTLYAHTNCV